MKTFRVIIILLVVLAAALMFSGSSSFSKAGALLPTPTPTPWPDLSTLTNFPNATGNKCGINGAGQSPEKKALNRLKNRFRLPSEEFESITFNNLLELNQGHANSQDDAIVGFPDSNDPNNQRAVTIEGFVVFAFAAGCAQHDHTGGESCNCNTTVKALCDTHINVLPQQGMSSAKGRNIYVVEITERIRRLAKLGLLTSNIGNNWSTAKLKAKLEGHRVRFSGFLFFDTDHASQAWVSDPQNNLGGPGGSNFRQTAWEIHPVMAIRVLD